MSKKNKKGNSKDNIKSVSEVIQEQEQEQYQEEIQEVIEEEVIVGLSINLLANGSVTVNVNETIDGEAISYVVLEDVLRRAHNTVYEQKIVQATLEAFKKSL